MGNDSKETITLSLGEARAIAAALRIGRRAVFRWLDSGMPSDSKAQFAAELDDAEWRIVNFLAEAGKN